VLFDGSLLVDLVLMGEKGWVNEFEIRDAAARHVVIHIAMSILHEWCELCLQGCQIAPVHHHQYCRRQYGLLG